MEEKKSDKMKEELISGLITIAIFVAGFLGVRACVNSCTVEDEFENDEWYNQSVGRQILMEKAGMKEEAKREQQMRREYMRQKSK